MPRDNPLSVHTPKSLLRALIEGGSVIDHSGISFGIRSEAARSILQWYEAREQRWQVNISDDDIEDITRAASAQPKQSTIYETTRGTTPVRRVHARRVRAHRFAGLHNFDADINQPDDFVLELEKKLLAINGRNGVGKTSIINAIVWCLTGSIYRAQREPEAADNVVVQAIVGPGNADVPVVAPIPHATALFSERTRVDVQTWVEIEFVNEIGTPVGRVRRTIQRSSRAAAEETFLSDLSFDPLTLEIGTRFPGLLQHIRIGKRSRLGAGVASLTGFRTLVDLSGHAERARRRIQAKAIPDAQRRQAVHQNRADAIRRSIAEHVLASELPGLDASSLRNRQVIEETRIALEAEHARLLADAVRLLGPSFEPKLADQRKALTRAIEPAIAAIQKENFQMRPAAARLGRLRKVRDEVREEAEGVLKTIVAEAITLDEMNSDPVIASRIRLYARIAGWLEEERTSLGTSCPVCGASLLGSIDSYTGEPVLDHIQKCASSAELWSHSIRSWDLSAQARLNSSLPESIRNELESALPAKPHELLREALVEEVFADPAFKGALAALKPSIASRCDAELELLPGLSNGTQPSLPPSFVGTKTATLAMRLHRVIAFSRWRQAQDEAWRNVFAKVIGLGPTNPSTSDSESWSLGERLAVLRRMAETARPVEQALEKIHELSESMKAIEQSSAQVAAYEQARSALEELIEIRTLVQRELDALVETLMESTLSWKKQIYGAPSSVAPQLARAAVAPRGELALAVDFGGVRVPAEAIANASDLRANLTAFFFAFWQHRWQTHGGISLILLDDIHELFDPENRRRIAEAIPRLIDAGARIVCTSNDEAFSRDLAAAATTQLGETQFERRCIHPLGSARHCLALGVFEDGVESKRMYFEENENDDPAAVEYLQVMRIYLEERILDFFDVSSGTLPYSPTLGDLLNAARSRRMNGVEPFTSPAFGSLIDDSALEQSSVVLSLLNRSHHASKATILYSDVKTIAPDLQRLRGRMESAYAARRHWLRRDKGTLKIQSESEYTLPASLNLPDGRLPVRWELAAFTRGATERGQELSIPEQLSLSWFTQKAAYQVTRPTFGFACPRGSFAIVQLADEEIQDNRLVVALHGKRTYARRLLRGRDPGGDVALGSEAENPLRRADSLFIPRAELRLLKVVGVLFNEEPFLDNVQAEAIPVDATARVLQAKIAYRVQGDSALPFVLPGQLVLGGEAIDPDKLLTLRGAVVAVQTNKGAFLKRVGEVVDVVRGLVIFESIGGLGSSEVAHTCEPQEESVFPVVRAVRQIVGVLYDS
jgi:hypothetical protein